MQASQIAGATAIIIATLITWQDFKSREVSLWKIIVLFFTLCTYWWFQNEPVSEWHCHIATLSHRHIIPSLLIIAFFFTTLAGISYFKGHTKQEFFSRIGIGDWLVLLAVTPLLTGFSMLLFIQSSALFALLCSIAFVLKKGKTYLIPFASYMCLVLIVILLSELLTSFRVNTILDIVLEWTINNS